MKRRNNMKVIQITGFRGLFLTLFVVVCLAAGFIAFPSLVAMKLWNLCANYIQLPLINIYQGAMLWVIVAIIGFIINDKTKCLIAFKAPKKLSDAEMAQLMEKIQIQAKAQMINSMILKDTKEIKKDDKENTESKENV